MPQSCRESFLVLILVDIFIRGAAEAAKTSRIMFVDETKMEGAVITEKSKSEAQKALDRLA